MNLYDNLDDLITCADYSTYYPYYHVFRKKTAGDYGIDIKYYYAPTKLPAKKFLDNVRETGLGDNDYSVFEYFFTFIMEEVQ